MYIDKEKDSVSSVIFNLIYDISKVKNEERARSTKTNSRRDASGIEGLKSLNLIAQELKISES